MRPSDVPKAPTQVCRRLREAGHEAWVVGGCVRDVQLGRAATDWDVATSAHPEEVQRLFSRTIPTGIAHGTVTVLAGAEPVEVTTFRGEGAYSDARRPDYVTFGVSLEEDLSRRDFTINAMAYDPIGDRLADPFAGAADLAARVIRAVGQAEARFAEDGLRVMRAVRFAAVLEFAIEGDTLRAIPQALPSLARVSVERVQVELLKLLASPRPSQGVEPGARTGIWATVLPELGGTADPPLHEIDATPGDAVRRLITWIAAERAAARAETLARRLKLANKDRERIVAVAAEAGGSSDLPDNALRRLVGRIGRERACDLVAVWQGLGRDLSGLRGRLETIFAQPVTIADLAVTGDDVMQALGVPGGRIVGDTLRALLERVLEDPGLNERERLLAIIAERGK